MPERGLLIRTLSILQQIHARERHRSKPIDGISWN